jgi:hypothetical protein
MSSVVISGDTSGAITLSAPAVSGTNTATLPAATGTVMVSGNMPAFSAYQGTSQTLTGGVYTKIALNTERFDTNSNFDSTTNYRFTPTVAGYYQINYEVYGTTTATISQFIGALYKNGSAYEYGIIGAANLSQAHSGATLVYMNGSTDYLELYINVNGTGTLTATTAGGTVNYMSGVLVRTA